MAAISFFGGQFFGGEFFNSSHTVDRTTGGGPPLVKWGEWTTPFTPEYPSDVRATLRKLIHDEHIRRGIEPPDPVADTAALEREIEARRLEERARTNRERRKAEQALRAAKTAREQALGAAYGAALDAAMRRYLEGEHLLLRRQRDDEDAVAVAMLMH